MHLFPGDYELRAAAKDLKSPVRKITLKAGNNAAQNLAMEPSPDMVGAARVVSFDEMYPPGPGAALVKATCVGCHGPNYLPDRQRPVQQWSTSVANMNRTGFVSFHPADQQAVVDYLGKNFGPNSLKRTLRWDKDMPVDEARLSKALYIEYYPTPNPPNTRKRTLQDPHFDRDGNVWFNDRSTPNRLLRLDPRSGEIKEWVFPNPTNDTHGVTVDSDGVVWTSELRGDIHLNGFNPKTEKFEQWQVDPKKQFGTLAYDTLIIDRAENVWLTLIYGDALAKWNRDAKEFSIYKTPTPKSFPYGIDVDSKGNIWIAEFVPGKVARFDPRARKWDEYATPTQPSKIRRVSVDANDTVWFGIYSHGKLGKLDPATGKVVEINIPQQFSQPYDVWPDPQGNIWISDNGQGGALIKYEPTANRFTHFPTPQLTDQPKLDITKDGAIWYCARSAPEGAVGVLYPDMTKVTTLGAYYRHGIAHGSKYLGSPVTRSLR
jgi:virginiamycin B lyase